MPSIATLASDTFRVLTFRTPSGPITEAWRSYLLFGLTFTWLAGMGRYWDNPRAELWQHLGLGSVVYVFCLAAIVWLLLLPLRPRLWTYRNVLVFLTLTSPPAVFYAIPVERFMSLDAAQTTNAWFLTIVATWRVALLVWFLRKLAGLRGFTIVVATALPLALIVFALTLLNLEHVVFNLMSGISPSHQSPNDLSYLVVMFLAGASFYATPVLVLSYAWLVYRRRSKTTDDA